MAQISILLPDLRGGGAERVSIDLAREFARLGHEVEFVLMAATGDFLVEAQQDFSVVDLATQRARNVTPALVRYLRRRRPDALVAEMWPLTVIAPLAARIARLDGKILISEHAMLSQQYANCGPAHRFALCTTAFAGYRLASVRVGVSQGTCNDMASLARMEPGRFKVIHNPVRPAAHAGPSDVEAASMMWGTNGPRILTVGNLKPVKNHPLLLQAFARLVRPDARLMVLGQGEEEAALRQLASDLDVADRVIFAGFHLNLSPFYATADLFVLSSNHEGFGNVIVEALSFGLPVVSTDCPSGPSEILQNGRFGRLVPVRDAAALARAMDDALAEPVNRASLIRRASEFSPDIAARKYLELLGLI